MIIAVSIFVIFFIAIIFLIMLKTVNLKFNNRLQDIKKRLESITQRLISKEKEAESFLYTVSHDLKTPLINIQTYTQNILNRYKDDEGLRKSLEVILTTVKDINKFIEAIAKLSRAGRIVGNPENVDINEVISTVKKEFKNQLEEKRINFVVKKKLPICYGNKERFYQIFLNLIGNSIKFIGEKPNTVIEIDYQESNPDDFYEFIVYDNGIGISPENHEKIFEIFQKLNPEKEGQGLGLSIVRRIVESHGCKIFVESEHGQFTKFHFTLPKGTGGIT